MHVQYLSLVCSCTLLEYTCVVSGFLHYISHRMVTVTFSDSSKTSVRISATACGADLLGAVKGHLTSSASVLWIVNRKGQDYIVKPERELVQFLEEDACHFYALDPSHVVGISSHSVFTSNFRKRLCCK